MHGEKHPSSSEPQELAHFLGLRNAARQHHRPIHDDAGSRQESNVDHSFYRIVFRHFDSRTGFCHYLLHDAVRLFAPAAAGPEDFDPANAVWNECLHLDRDQRMALKR